MRAEAYQEAHFPVPPEENPQILVDAERPVVGQVAFELVSTKQGILGIGRKAPKRGPQQGVARWPELSGAANEA